MKESVTAKIRFGGMVHDLACYVDSCLRYDEAGNIVGRNGGIRAWIAENIPELSPRYKTIMRYKALAMRVRQLAGLKDPQPTSVLLDGLAGGWSEKSDGEAVKAFDASAKAHGSESMVPNGMEKQAKGSPARIKNYYAQDSHFSREPNGAKQWSDGTKRWLDGARRGLDGAGSKQKRLEQKRRRLGQALAKCQNTFKDVFDKLDSALGLDEQEFG